MPEPREPQIYNTVDTKVVGSSVVGKTEPNPELEKIIERATEARNSKAEKSSQIGIIEENEVPEHIGVESAGAVASESVQIERPNSAEIPYAQLSYLDKLIADGQNSQKQGVNINKDIRPTTSPENNTPENFVNNPEQLKIEISFVAKPEPKKGKFDKMVGNAYNAVASRFGYESEDTKNLKKRQQAEAAKELVIEKYNNSCTNFYSALKNIGFDRKAMVEQTKIIEKNQSLFYLDTVDQVSKYFKQHNIQADPKILLLVLKEFKKLNRSALEMQQYADLFLTGLEYTRELPPTAKAFDVLEKIAANPNLINLTHFDNGNPLFIDSEKERYFIGERANPDTVREYLSNAVKALEGKRVKVENGGILTPGQFAFSKEGKDFYALLPLQGNRILCAANDGSYTIAKYKIPEVAQPPQQIEEDLVVAPPVINEIGSSIAETLIPPAENLDLELINKKTIETLDVIIPETKDTETSETVVVEIKEDIKTEIVDNPQNLIDVPENADADLPKAILIPKAPQSKEDAIKERYRDLKDSIESKGDLDENVDPYDILDKVLGLTHTDVSPRFKMIYSENNLNVRTQEQLNHRLGNEIKNMKDKLKEAWVKEWLKEGIIDQAEAELFSIGGDRKIFTKDWLDQNKEIKFAPFIYEMVNSTEQLTSADVGKKVQEKYYDMLQNKELAQYAIEKKQDEIKKGLEKQKEVKELYNNMFSDRLKQIGLDPNLVSDKYKNGKWMQEVIIDNNGNYNVEKMNDVLLKTLTEELALQGRLFIDNKIKVNAEVIYNSTNNTTVQRQAIVRGFMSQFCTNIKDVQTRNAFTDLIIGSKFGDDTVVGLEDDYKKFITSKLKEQFEGSAAQSTSNEEKKPVVNSSETTPSPVKPIIDIDNSLEVKPKPKSEGLVDGLEPVLPNPAIVIEPKVEISNPNMNLNLSSAESINSSDLSEKSKNILSSIGYVLQGDEETNLSAKALDLIDDKLVSNIDEASLDLASTELLAKFTEYLNDNSTAALNVNVAAEMFIRERTNLTNINASSLKTILALSVLEGDGKYIVFNTDLAHEFLQNYQSDVVPLPAPWENAATDEALKVFAGLVNKIGYKPKLQESEFILRFNRQIDESNAMSESDGINQTTLNIVVEDIIISLKEVVKPTTEKEAINDIVAEFCKNNFNQQSIIPIQSALLEIAQLTQQNKETKPSHFLLISAIKNVGITTSTEDISKEQLRYTYADKIDDLAYDFFTKFVNNRKFIESADKEKIEKTTDSLFEKNIQGVSVLKINLSNEEIENTMYNVSAEIIAQKFIDYLNTNDVKPEQSPNAANEFLKNNFALSPSEQVSLGNMLVATTVLTDPTGNFVFKLTESRQKIEAIANLFKELDSGISKKNS